MAEREAARQAAKEREAAQLAAAQAAEAAAHEATRKAEEQGFERQGSPSMRREKPLRQPSERPPLHAGEQAAERRSVEGGIATI